MMAELVYIARDGRRFTDALQCQQYESTIGILPGSVGMMINELERLPQDYYVNGMAFIRDKDGSSHTFHLVTRCIDEDIDESDPLFSEKSISITVSQAIKLLHHLYDKDSPCQYIYLVTKKVTDSAGRIIINMNPEVFKNK